MAAFTPNRRTASAGPTCATCGTRVTATDLPGPRWQIDLWFGPDTTHTPNGSPLKCAECADADLRASYGRR
ncbi:hypothetical protein [Micromonospora sp. NPDC005254]|uniref:hypothetical protein n=1 Tax=Micromonospora sp. NPDC005254 TaxID=3364229 RepID=UPI0036B2BB83